MAFASITRLRVRSLRFLPEFVLRTFLSQRQVVRAGGFLGGRLLADRKWTFWTLTVWDGDKSMRAFRGTAAHGKVMPKLADWCDEASYAHWTLEGSQVPAWQEAYEQLLAVGRLSPVQHPSPDHTNGKFSGPQRLTLAADLDPVRS